MPIASLSVGFYGDDWTLKSAFSKVFEFSVQKFVNFVRKALKYSNA